jgi:periplasmic protein TonB
MPSPPPPPDPAKTPVADGDAGPMGDLQDPTHKMLHPATADTGNLPPVYPSEAVALHEQGQVTLRLHINTEGQVAQAEIAVSSGSAALDKAALAAISAWHFHPAQQRGKPVPDIIEMGIAFRMP